MQIVVDIETRAADLSPLEADAYVLGAIPGSFKKPESIAAWIAEHRDEVLARTALDSMAGEIVAIGYAIDDEPPHIEAGPDPAALLMWFADRVGNLDEAPIWIGHNVLGFDIPFLRRHAARYNVARLLCALPGGVGDKWGARVHDTAAIWASTDYRAHFRLGDIARFLGLAANATSGAEIAGMVAAGDYDAICEHCRQDVELTRAVYRRIVPTAAAIMQAARTDAERGR